MSFLSSFDTYCLSKRKRKQRTCNAVCVIWFIFHDVNIAPKSHKQLACKNTDFIQWLFVSPHTEAYFFVMTSGWWNVLPNALNYFHWMFDLSARLADRKLLHMNTLMGSPSSKVSCWLTSSFAHTVASVWALWHLKSPASPSYTQAFIQAQINENIIAPRQWPLCGDFPAQKASNAENVSIWWRHHAKRHWYHAAWCDN